ncbi:MAG TPA: ABC transporter permease [Caldilineaceae bacterium]|nr:ABC transporter permease [Caldilineaceae bacterium]HRW09363.1 ABC transporter permease [Caldilineaceae bacterium]
MLLIIARRIVAAFFTLLFISVLVFALTEVLPGDVATALLGRDATPEQLASLRTELGLNQPAHTRYQEWLAGAVRGDLGVSLANETPIRPVVLIRLRNTALLAAVTLLFSIPLALMLGVIAGLLRDRLPDLLISFFTLIGMSLPGYVIGVLLILVISIRLAWLPAVTLVAPNAPLWQFLPYVILPALTVTVGLIAYLIRLLRTNIIDVMTSNYVQMATLKGVPYPQVVLRHALPSALLPAINALALLIADLLGGVVIAETLFNYPGLGRLMITAVTTRDLPMVQAIALVGAAIYISVNLVADLLAMLLNPRLRTWITQT